MIIGPSGAGKSALALQLIALGATLVADDRTRVSRRGDGVVADVPESIAGMIEARGLGILRVPGAGPTPLALVVDLSRAEQDRLPLPGPIRCWGWIFPACTGSTARISPLPSCFICGAA
ncbi:HPr kinase/phosphorylase [Sulfitobacter porphyrae]|uniref:HPr kinase/phosphorylase n=1 Tax=Sulfitobacter porphyrae TaxID=1246864 RepID=A0ABW2AZI3_9RHOB